MPYPTGYSAPLVGPLGQQGNNTPENAGWANGVPYMNVGGQRVTVPMQNGFPTWNSAYNIYGNPSAAQARYNQIGGTNPNAGASGVNTGMPNIPTIPNAGGGAGGSAGYGSPLPGGSTFFGSQVNDGGGGVGSGAGIGSVPSSSISTSSPSIESITNLVNTLNRQSQQQANDARIPNGAALNQQSSNNIASLLGGNIPADQVYKLNQQAAERGIAMGSPGSDNSNSELLRALGLTSLGLQQQGEQNLSAAYARNPGAPIYNAGEQVLSAAQKAQVDAENARLALAWYQTLHPNYGGYGRGGGGGYPSGGGGGSDSALPSWFPTLGGTPSSSSVKPTPYSSGGGTLTSVTTTPSGSGYVNTGQNWGDLFGDPYAQIPGQVGVNANPPPDASNPNYWDWGQQLPPDTFDPLVYGR